MTSPFIPRLPTLPGVGGPTFGGQQGAPSGDPFAALKNLERLEQLSMAAEGVKAYEASQAAPEPIPPPAVEEPEDKSWWRNVIDPVMGGLQKYAAFTEAQTGLLGSPLSYTTGIWSKLGIPMGDEEDRFDRLNAIRMQVLRGELSVVEGGRRAREIHNERGGFHKFMLESTSPQGLLEMLIPVGKAGAVLKPFTRAARPITRPVLKAAAPLAKAVPGLRRSQIAQEIRPGYAKQADEAGSIPEQILEESVSPVPELRGAKAVIAEQTRAQETVYGQAIQKLAVKLEKIPYLGNLALTPIKWFNPNALADLSSKGTNRFVEQYIIYDGIGKEMARDSAKLMTFKILAQGDPKTLFNLGDDFAYAAPTATFQQRTRARLGQQIEPAHVITRKDGTPLSRLGRDKKPRKLFFNEIAQFPEEFNLSAAQKGWLDNFKRSTDDMITYLKKEGVVPEDFLTKIGKGKVFGNYFPGFWKMLDDIPLGQATGDASKTAFWEKSRYYELASEALDAGFRPGDPMEAVELLYHSMYRQVHDKELATIARQMGNAMDTRISKDKIIKKRTAQQRLKGSTAARDFINILAYAGVGPAGPNLAKLAKSKKAFQGFNAAMKAEPGLMKEVAGIANIWNINDLADQPMYQIRAIFQGREALLQQTAEKAAIRQANAKTAFKAASKELAGARAAAKLDTRIGEVELSFRSGNVILTPDDVVDKIFPERMINNVKTVPRAELERLEKAIEKSGNSFKVLTDVSNAMRTLRAGTDLGVMFIHGLPTLFRNPSAWAKSTKHSLEAFKDPRATARLIDDNWETVKDLVQFNQLHGGGSEFIEGLRDNGLLMRATGWAAKKPAIGIVAKGGEKYLKGIERQFDGWLMASKIHLWKAMKPMAIAGKTKGSTEYIKSLEELASHVAKMTGTLSTANMGITPTTRNVMGTFLMFAPRYRMATYGLMADVVRGGVRGDQARRTMGSMLFAGISTYVIVSNRLGQTPNLDPTDGKFLTLKIGDGRVGIGSAFVSLARFAGNIFETSMEKPEDFVSLNSSDNPMMKFARGQLSPISGTGWDAASGRNFIGEPTHGGAPFFENIVAEGLLPFWASSYTDHPRAGVGIGPAEFMGFRGFPMNLNDKAEQLADIQAANIKRDDPNDLPAEKFDDLNKYEKSKLLQANPDIQQLYDESNQLWLERSAGLPLKMNEYRAGQKEIRDYYRGAMNGLLEDLQTGGDARSFRNELHALNATRAAMYERLTKKSTEAIDALNELGDNPDAHAEDIAYADYVQTIILGDFENEEGEFNFDAQAEAVSEWQTTWGSANYAYVQKYLERDLKPLEMELRNGRQKHSTYWAVGKRILQNMGYENDIPNWNKYMAARKIVREEMEIEYPIFKKVRRAQTLARQQMRDLNPELDKFLYRWNYTDNLRQGTPDRAELLISLLKY